MHVQVVAMVGIKGCIKACLSTLKVSAMVKRHSQVQSYEDEVCDHEDTGTTDDVVQPTPCPSQAKLRTKSKQKGSQKVRGKKKGNQESSRTAPPGHVWRLLTIGTETSTQTTETSFERDHLASMREAMLVDTITMDDFND